MLYQNRSRITKTFYGVSFAPNDVKEVPGVISDVSFVRLSKMPQEPPKSVDVPKKKPGPKPGFKLMNADNTVSESTTSVESTIEKEETPDGTNSNK